MSVQVIPLDQLLPTVRQLSAACHGGARIVTPVGAMVHFDDSASDASGEGWFRSPDCKNGYNRYYLDDGSVVQLTPSMLEAARHAGRCQQKNANSSFYGLAIAAKDGDVVKAPQWRSLVVDLVSLARFHGWRPENVAAWLFGHDEQAVFTEAEFPKNPEKWGKLGRKVDPTGTRPDRPVLSMAQLRLEVKTHLGG